MIEYLRIIDSDHLTEILHVASQIPKLTKAHTGDVDDAEHLGDCYVGGLSVRHSRA